MATATELISESLAILGTYDAGGSPSSAELASDLKTLNFMRKSLAADLEFQQRVEEGFNLSPSVITYEWYNSAGADFQSQPPIKLTDVYVSFNSLDYRLRGMGRAEVAGIGDKMVRTGIPDSYFYEQDTSSTPATGFVSLYPAPAASGLILIASVKAPADLALTGTLDEPGEVLEALIWGLAVRLAPKYGTKVTPEIAATAQLSMQRAKRSRMDDTVSVRGDTNFFGGGGARL